MTLFPFDDAQAVYQDWCDRGGEPFEFTVSNSTGHVKENIMEAPAVVKWINKIINGGAPIKGCPKTLR